MLTQEPSLSSYANKLLVFALKLNSLLIIFHLIEICPGYEYGWFNWFKSQYRQNFSLEILILEPI